MIITAASFPTPDFIKRSNNPAVWDQQARFADHQAAAANQALERLGSALGTASTPLERSAAFVRLYRDLAQWRFELAHRTEGQSPGAGIEQYRTPIGGATMVDTFARGLRTEGSRFNTETAEITKGLDTPASRLTDRLAGLIQARFEAEAPDREVLQNWVRLPSGQATAGNLLLRGKAATDLAGRSGPIDGYYCSATGALANRRALQREAFGILTDLETQRAEGRADLIDDPAARQAFVEAEYFMYQGPEYQRGGDATIRTLLVASHAHVFGAAPKLPQDIDVMAYVAGQDAFRAHVNRTQSVLTNSTAPAGRTHESPARNHQRAGGLERG